MNPITIINQISRLFKLLEDNYSYFLLFFHFMQCLPFIYIGIRVIFILLNFLINRFSNFIELINTVINSFFELIEFTICLINEILIKLLRFIIDFLYFAFTFLYNNRSYLVYFVTEIKYFFVISVGMVKILFIVFYIQFKDFEFNVIGVKKTKTTVTENRPILNESNQNDKFIAENEVIANQKQIKNEKSDILLIENEFILNEKDITSKQTEDVIFEKQTTVVWRNPISQKDKTFLNKWVLENFKPTVNWPNKDQRKQLVEQTDLSFKEITRYFNNKDYINNFLKFKREQEENDIIMQQFNKSNYIKGQDLTDIAKRLNNEEK